jgi:glycosyltransferase involved in cell wall biosynthesis
MDINEYGDLVQKNIPGLMRKNIAIIENHIISTNTVRQKLTQVLIDQGYDVTILSTGTQKELAIAKSKNFKVIDIGTSNTKPGDVLVYIKNLRAALKKTRADVCLTFTMRPAIWGNMVTRLMKIPTITNITGIGPLAESETYAYKIARTLYRIVLKKTAVVYFQNKDDLDIFLRKKFVKASQAAIIPGSGVDYEHFAPMPKKRNDGKFVFLFISRLIKDKGILEYVAAARQLAGTHENIVCQVLGPYYSQNLKENIITEKQIMHWLDEGIVQYLGAADDVRPFIAEADCIVLPSYREGMSNVLLEAGSMQKPCITSDTTGCNNIVIDAVTGYLCKVKDADDLAEKMEKIINISAEERKEMGIKAREIVKEKFAKKIVTDAYQQAICKILKSS